MEVRQKIEAVRDRLGKVPDRTIAKEVGCSARSVADYRREHGIPGFKGRPPVPSEKKTSTRRRRKGRKPPEVEAALAAHPEK